MLVAVCVVVVLAYSTGCHRDEPGPKTADAPAREIWFKEVGDSAGLNFTQVPFFQRRYYAPEIIAGGVGLLDYDNDGDLDVYFVQAGDLDRPDESGPGNQLFRNHGDGTFEEVTETAGVGDHGYGMGCACADFDRDGDTDIYVTNVGPNVLYRNNGDGTFTDVSAAAGTADPSWSASAAFFDYDGDGYLDLYVANYLNWSQERELVCRSASDERDYCSPKNYQAPLRDTLYRNEGDGTFTDVSDAVGLGAAFGNGLGVAPGDFNRDGFVDVYVANDAMENQLWLGSSTGRFTNRALLFGCALSGAGSTEAGMGVVAVDVDNDGDLDLFLSHLRNETNTVYLNTDGMFDDATSRFGLATPSLPFTGFGLGFYDFDQDGLLDVYVSNGRVTLHTPVFRRDDRFAEPNLLLKGRRGDGGIRFEEVSPRGGTEKPLIETSRAAAFGDLDNDGDVDIVVVNEGTRAYLLKNVVPSKGRVIMFRVINRYGTDAVGASLRITAGGSVWWRYVQPGYSYCASNDPRVHVGLGRAATVDEVLVRWPDGSTDTFGPFRAGHPYRLIEGGAARREDR